MIQEDTNLANSARRRILHVRSLLSLPRRLLLLRLIIVAGWGTMLIGIPRFPFALYLVPLLSLMTFCLLSPFPIILVALILTGYMDSLHAYGVTSLTPLISTLMVWLAAIVALFVLRTVSRPAEIREQASPPGSATAVIPDQRASAPQPVVSPPIASITNLRHDLRTPINMIAGFCEALLRPTSPYREPLPALYRHDVEAILRNSQQLEQLIASVLDNRIVFGPIKDGSEPAPATTLKTLVLIDESGAALELFSQYARRFDIVRVPNIEALGRMKLKNSPVAVVISGDNAPIPVVAELVGHRIPILTFDLAGEHSPAKPRAANAYLMKPVEIEALAAVLPHGGALLQNVLIVDDNRDSVQMLSRMLSDLSPSAQVWKAYSGREALALLREQRPDAILLDFTLPDMDGTAILDYLRSDGKLNQVPIVLVSAHRPPDIAPLPGVTRLTLSSLAGFTPAQIVQYVEALFSDPGPHS